MTDWIQLLTTLAALLGVFAWLRQDIKQLRQEIKAQGERTDNLGKELNGRIDNLGKELCQDNKDLGDELRREAKDQGLRLVQVERSLDSLKATVETFFRVRVDPPDPDGKPRTGTDG